MKPLPRPNPALVTQAMCRPLPLWGWALLLAAFLLPGWIDREPWRGHEMAMLGIVDHWQQASFGLSQAILDQPQTAYGWLFHAAVWLSVQMIAPLDPLWAGRAWGFVGTAVGLWSTRQAMFYLAQHPRAQPMQLALGGEAKAREAGKLRAEGKAYLVQDGDVMHFLHS